MSEFIWIVDDDVSVRNSIEQHLDSDGLNAQCFQDGDEAFLALVRQALVSTS
jgi:FixJ family two-component response regulator